MLAICSATTNEIPLTDERIEDSSTLKLLLDLIHNDIFPDFRAIDFRVILVLIDLAEKYECATVLHTIKQLTARPPAPDDFVWKGFYYACALNDIETAHRYIPAAAKRIWLSTAAHEGSPNGVGPDLTVVGASVLDVTGTSDSILAHLPPRCFMSLLRSTRLRMTTPPGTWQAVADDWKMQMASYGE